MLIGTEPMKKGAGGRNKIIYDAEQLKTLVALQKSNAEIALAMGVSTTTVVKWIRAEGLTGRRKTGHKGREFPEAIGRNTDRHLCRSCRFRATDPFKANGAGCDYIGAAGHSRGCRAENCNVYEKGKPKSKIRAQRL